MAIYALSQRTTATSSANPSWEVRTDSDCSPSVMEVGISQNAATAGVYGLGRPGAIGVTPTSAQYFVAENGNSLPTSQSTACVAWGTPPTVPANFNRRISCAATVGVGVIWTFPRGFQIPVSSSIVIWLIAAAPVCDVWAVIDE